MNYTTMESAAYYSSKEMPFVFVTILKTEGSTSRNQGTMVVNERGQISGTIGGGEVEAYALTQSLSLLATGEKYRHVQCSVQKEGSKSVGDAYLFLLNCTTNHERHAFITLHRWETLQLEHVFGLQFQPTVEILGLCAGGATIGNVHPTFLEKAQQVLAAKETQYIETEAWSCHLSLPLNHHDILLVGGGHVNQAIAHLAHFLGISTQVVETREEFATKELFEHARARIIAPTLEEAVLKASTTKHTAVVVASHAQGEQLAHLLLQRDFCYVGILGSRHKAKKLAKNLNIAPSDEKRLFCPIGLDLGTETPQEIALSTLAEIMKVFNNRSGKCMKHLANNIIVVRGGGDLATGVIIRLKQAGYRPIVLEVEKPTVIRTTVSVAQAVFDGSIVIEGERAQLCKDVKEAFSVLEANNIPVLVDPEGESLANIGAVCVVDAIMAKRNLGTKIDDAPLVIAIGPGFEAGTDCDYVIETKRGHNLGRIIAEGSATENTGIPGIIAGYGRERVVHSPAEGVFSRKKEIGDLVQKGDLIAMVGDTNVYAPLDGKLRGLLNNGLFVPVGFKIADVDPRAKDADHTTVSDKALAVGSAVVIALDGFLQKA